MKSLLAVAALLAGLAAPALAEDATTAAPPPPAPAVSPSQQASLPAALPQSKPVQVVPMSTLLESNGPPPSRGGCHHDAEQVYLTN